MSQPPGQKLKAAREERGLTLADVSHATRIPVQRLQMLEQDNYAGFGGMAYARLFLRAYCTYLGMNAAEALEHLPKPRPSRIGRCWKSRCFPGHYPEKERPTNPRKLATQETWYLLRAAFLMSLFLIGLTGLWTWHLLRESLPAAAVSAKPSLIAPSPRNAALSTALPTQAANNLVSSAQLGPVPIRGKIHLGNEPTRLGEKLPE
ncbi:MAG: helix-turn-helix domain-containing protein [Prosthecobacter sp.]|nr:helix-turn-helix domain-containing protein [Prosthecobacter sp.]